jgi:hypothetical protein
MFKKSSFDAPSLATLAMLEASDKLELSLLQVMVLSSADYLYLTIYHI